MFDTTHNVPLRTVIATMLWLIAFTLVALEVVLEVTTEDTRWVGVGALGLFAGMGGATLTVRGYFCRFANQLETHEVDWERQAFELGYDAAQRRPDGKVRPLH